MTSPATREDVARLADAIHEMTETTRQAAQDQGDILRQIAESFRPIGHVQQVTVPVAQPQRAERQVAAMATICTVMAFLAGGAIVAAVLQGQRIGDLVVLQASLRAETKAEVLAERASRERFEAWAAQEANTMRTFAKTGVLAPMQPRPSTAAPPDHRP